MQPLQNMEYLEKDLQYEVEKKLELYDDLLNEVKSNSNLIDFSGTDYVDETTLDCLDVVLDISEELIQAIRDFKYNLELVRAEVNYQNKLAWA